MFNKAIFLYTMKRFAHWYTLLSVFISLILVSFFAAGLLLINDRAIKEFAYTILFGPMTALLAGYSIVIPQVANAQLRKDGEYLSLIFTRPVSRWSYVMTKWLSGVLVVLVINILLTAMTYALLLIAHQFIQPNVHLQIIDKYAIYDIIGNALGYTSLMVLISTVPHPWGKIILIILVYCALFATMVSGALAYLADSLTLTTLARPLAALGEFILSLFSVSIDSYHIVNSASFPLSNIVIFISNIVLYLTASVFIMSIREFFYAND